MPVVKQKPTSPARRGMVRVTSTGLHKGRSVPSLTQPKSATNGRNNAGRITVRHRGGGHKRHYRVIDFGRKKDSIPAKVERLEYAVPVHGTHAVRSSFGSSPGEHTEHV